MFELIFIFFAVAFLINATKLRWQTVYHTVADGTTSSDDGASLVNRTDADMHVITIERDLSLAAAGPGEEGNFQLSTQNSYNNVNDGETVFRKSRTVGMPATGATPSDGDTAAFDVLRYLRGEVVLEPGEALHSSILKSTGGSATARYNIGVVFEE